MGISKLLGGEKRDGALENRHRGGAVAARSRIAIGNSMVVARVVVGQNDHVVAMHTVCARSEVSRPPVCVSRLSRRADTSPDTPFLKPYAAEEHLRY